MFTAILAVSLGAALGALSRWGLGLGLNHVFPALPPGTLLANLIGGYLVGLAVALFALRPELPAEWRLFVITGFLGGLTTFSTFSAEVVQALQAGRTGWALATVATHVLGSLLLTLAGLATPALLKG
ncbi:camphor resistance protein CrcB [beta proteobacterium AAP51]|nr:camphor resistance protein CrcB [beta proteobacterium AAP51]